MKNNLIKIWIARAMLLLAMSVVTEPILAEDERVSLNFVNADIVEVIKAVSQISKRNFLIDPRVKGTINIVSATPVPANLAYDILLSALRLQGFAAVESDGVTKVMPESDAKLYIPNTNNKNGTGDKLVTRVYMLQYESAAQLVPILRPLIAPNNVVVAYPNNNALVITDYASNLKRIEQIVETIDQPVSAGPVIIPVQNTSAVDLVQIITRLMSDGQQAGGGASDASQRFVLVADVRSNSLLLRTDSPAKVHRVRDLVEKLDIKTSAPGNVHVVYLKNADATKLAQTLRAVLSGDTSVATANATAGATPPVTSSAPSGGGTIQADASSNSLIITTSETNYNNIRAVIEQLDTRRAQVFVEAMIAEVTMDKAAQLGIQWQNFNGVNNSGTGTIGGTNFGSQGGGSGNIISAAGTSATSNITTTVSSGLNVGIVNGTTNIPGVGTVLNLGALVNLLQNDANTNILSTPNLLTLDNEEAKIIIGQNVPFVTGSYAQTGAATTASPFQTIERKDVGLTLRIKPQVSQGGTVKMQIFAEDSSVQASTVSNAAGIITNKRSLESTVLVDEGQLIVLGGLMQDSVSEGVSKVPILGDIPFIGALFRSETRQRNKTNLMIFIRPHVMRSADSYQSISQDRYEYIRGAQTESQMPSRWALPDMVAPTLPEMTQGHSAPAVTKPPEMPQSQSSPAAVDVLKP